jgi:2-oxoglutarate ferredoxin oxidoreductase subunit alpha
MPQAWGAFPGDGPIIRRILDTQVPEVERTVETLDSVVIRFAGDSGDGMQLTGSQFTETSALAGNDLATFPDFPAEIRAPAGTLAGVSGFQIHFSSEHVFTPGDAVDVLVGMNPAALRANLGDVRKGGVLILDTAGFNARNLEKAGYKSDPRTDGALSPWRVIEIDITDLTLKAIEDLRLPVRTASRSKNMFALGVVYWMFSRSLEHTLAWIDSKFSKKPEIKEANVLSLKAGYNYGLTHELFAHVYEVKPAQLEPGLYCTISGNEALAYGLIAAAELSGLPLFYASYPITPASPILHYLASQKALGVRTFQAEDEIAAACSAVGAAYAGALAVTATSGPGVALKGETIALATALELPMIIVNVQRAGPATGMPTKTEQADLLQAMYGRHGESPVPIVAAQSPGDCFYAAIEAARIAVRQMTPVFLLSDGYIANGAEPWRIPNVADLPRIPVKFHTDPATFQAYGRNEELARPWALPGTPGLEHRVGGLEKAHLTGNISYDPENHERMSRLRLEKVNRIAKHYGPTEVFGDDEGALLLVSWGGTFGAVREGVTRARKRGHKIGHVHLRHLNPFPTDLGDILRKFDRVVVPELNLGQLSKVLRSEYLVDARAHTKIQGQPFRVVEIEEAIRAQLEAN